jgi:hypothetical protein
MLSSSGLVVILREDSSENKIGHLQRRPENQGDYLSAFISYQKIPSLPV